MYKKYDREFKINLVLMHKNGNRSKSEVCKEFGIPESTFSGWVKEYDKENSFPGSGNVKASNKEMLELQKKSDDIKIEIDILKKFIEYNSKKK